MSDRRRLRPSASSTGVSLGRVPQARSSIAIFLAVVALLIASLMPRAAYAEEGFLDPGKAFHFDARVADATHVEVSFDIAPGYYMYREQFQFAARGATLGAADLPAGHVKFDETFQKNVETYRGRLSIGLPVAAGGGGGASADSVAGSLSGSVVGSVVGSVATRPAGAAKGAAPFILSVVSQGCSDRGICYPPSVNHVEVRLTAADGSPGSVRLLPVTPYMPGSDPGASVDAALPGGVASALDLGGSRASSTSSSLSSASGTNSTSVPEAARINTASPVDASHFGDGIQAALQSGRYLSVIGVFLLAGVLLSLTPCVLPMLPILSSIIVGEEARVAARPSPSHPLVDRKAEIGIDTRSTARPASPASPPWAVRGRSFALACSYSLGMALVYTALGVAAGLAGEGLAAALQKPWVLGLFALSLAALALSMFGVYELRLPSAFTGRMTSASTNIQGGRIVGVFLMGGVSALIVSPCVAAPLAGALVYISQTRDATLGGVALFSLAVGMSVPLLLVGASAGALLPRAGPWMEGVKRVFGVLLLAVAVWIVQPVLPAPAVLALWGVLLICCAIALGLFDPAVRRGLGVSLRIRKSGAVLLAVFGVVQIVGAASGGTDPLQPLSHWAGQGATGTANTGATSPGTATSEAMPSFAMVRSSADLDEALRTAGRPVMLDFYADWCVSCKEMERFTYTDAAVKARLAGALLLKADVTRNSPEDRELLRRFNLFGPPGTLFFDAQGKEMADRRVIGFQSAERFGQTLQAAGL